MRTYGANPSRCAAAVGRPPKGHVGGPGRRCARCLQRCARALAAITHHFELATREWLEIGDRPCHARRRTSTRDAIRHGGTMAFFDSPPGLMDGRKGEGGWPPGCRGIERVRSPSGRKECAHGSPGTVQLPSQHGGAVRRARHDDTRACCRLEADKGTRVGNRRRWPDRGRGAPTTRVPISSACYKRAHAVHDSYERRPWRHPDVAGMRHSAPNGWPSTTPSIGASGRARGSYSGSPKKGAPIDAAVPRKCVPHEVRWRVGLRGRGGTS